MKSLWLYAIFGVFLIALCFVRELNLQRQQGAPAVETTTMQSRIIDKHLGKRISPIVEPKLKLIYFYIPKNGCTTWKMILQSVKNVTSEPGTQLPIHIREKNGLEYLDQYNVSIANQWLTDPEWHKFIIVRDPKERFLSAYLEKGTMGHPIVRSCCNSQPDSLACEKTSTETADGFFDMMQFCNDVHWLPQTLRLTKKLWSTINFMAHFETFGEDSIIFAKRIGLPEDAYKDKLVVRPHSTNASDKLKQYISKELERKLDEYYKVDYENEMLGYKRYSIYS